MNNRNLVLDNQSVINSIKEPSMEVENERVKMSSDGLSVYYDDFKALKEIDMEVYQNRVTALIGPSGCGKSTYIRSFNRMNDIIPKIRIDGAVVLDGRNIYEEEVDVVDVRRRVGMVFQKSNPFPKSIYENIAYGLKVNRFPKSEITDRVEESIKGAALWDEVKDRLYDSALMLSGGQQQRLCIARALALQPEVLLMDEPASALDPIATQKIEELIQELKQQYTIVIVTHNMQQAARVSDYTAFFYLGELIEFGETSKIFTNPDKKMTDEYITGRFG